MLGGVSREGRAPEIFPCILTHKLFVVAIYIRDHGATT